MAGEKLQDLNIASLEEIFTTTKKEIETIKNKIINTLKIEIPDDIRNSETFIGDLKKSIQSLTKSLDTSELRQQLSSKNIYLTSVIQELELRRKELFENLFIGYKVPLDKLSKLESFLSNYQTEAYKEKQSQQINLVKDKSSLQITMDTDLSDIEDFPVRARNILNLCGAKTVGGLIKFFKEREKKDILRLRGFGQKSYDYIEKFLQNNDLLTENTTSQQLSMNTEIGDLDISVGALYCLKTSDINTLYYLVKIFKEESEKDILEKRNFGKKSYDELKKFLQENNLLAEDKSSLVSLLMDTKIEDRNNLPEKYKKMLLKRGIRTVGRLVELFKGKNKQDTMKEIAFSEAAYKELKKFLQENKFLPEDNASQKLTMDTSIDALNLPVRARNRLRSKGIKTIGELVKVFKDENEKDSLERMIGKGSYNEVRDILQINNLLAEDKSSLPLSMKTEIKDLDIPTLCKTALHDLGTLGKLVKLFNSERKEDILRIRNLKEKSYDEIENFLKENKFLPENKSFVSLLMDSKIEDINGLPEKYKKLLLRRAIRTLGGFVGLFKGKYKQDIMKDNGFSETACNELERFLQEHNLYL